MLLRWYFFHMISIHALRVESDADLQQQLRQLQDISIHALRVESDAHARIIYIYSLIISIHALRVESDL